MVQKTLYFIFLDLWKAYDTVNRERRLEILERYGVGPNVLGLLRFYWNNQPCVAKCVNYHGKTFVLFHGLTQGGVISPTLFNVLIDAVVRKWLADDTDDMIITSTGLQGDNTGCIFSLCYANDWTIGSLYHEWLQNANQHLCNLVRDYMGLKPNTEKTEATRRNPGTMLNGRL